MKRILVLGVTLLALALLSGCGVADRIVENATEKAVGNLVEQATGVSVDEDEGTVTIKGKDGEQVEISGTEGKLAEGFPLPLYDGAKVNSSGRMSVNGKTSYTAEIAFGGDATAVADYYEKVMKERGIEEVNRIESDSDGELIIILTGESPSETGWITVTFDKAAKEGSVAFIYGDK